MGETLLHETKIHGTIDFPYIVYPGRIPEYIQTYPPHWHEEMELIYVTEGRLKVTVWSEQYDLSAGDIVIVLPHVIHSIEQAGEESAQYYNVVFHFSILGEDACAEKYLKPFLTHEKTVNSFVRNRSALNERLKPLLKSLIENRRSSYSTHEYLVKGNLFMIMHLLNQHCMEAKEEETAMHMTYDRLKAALYWIQLRSCLSKKRLLCADFRKAIL